MRLLRMRSGDRKLHDPWFARDPPPAMLQSGRSWANCVDRTSAVRHRGGMETADQLHDAERRVWARLPAGTREALDRLSATDLQTLLLSLARLRSARVRPT